MKRVIILSLCLLLTMAVRSQSWRTNADAFIVNQLFVNNVGHVDIYAFPELLYGSDYVFSIDGDTIQVPYQNCVGYFIDLMPFAHWAHPCKYCFVDASNHYTIIDAEMPPQCNNLVPVCLLPRVNPAPMTFAVDTTAPRIVQHDNSNHLWAVLICGDECESHFRDDCLIPEYWFDLSSVYTVLTNKFGYQEASTTYGDPSDRRIIVSAPTALKNRYTFQQYDLNGNNSYNSNTGVAVGDFFDYNETTETKHSKATIDSIFKCFAGDEHCLQVYHDQGLVELTEEDQLFIFVTGIGRRDDGLNKSYFTVHDMGQDRERIYDDEFASLLRGIKCSQMTLVMANNYSGGFVDEFMNDISHPDCQCKNRIAQSAASADGYAYGEEHNVYYNNSGNYASCVTEFVYYWASSALGYYPYFNTYDGSVGPWSVPSVGRKVGDGSMNWSHYFGTVSEQQNPHALYDVNPDSDNDGILSLREMFEFANDLDSWSEEGYYNSAYDPAYYSWYVPEEPQQQYESTFTKEAATLVGYEGQIDSIANSGTAVQPYRLCGDIWVSSDSELIMWDEVQSPGNVRIYVKPSGKLILDGAKLTNLPEEQRPMWKGVQVWGNNGKHQIVENGRYWQGVLEMKNGAIIQNAITGIDVWNPEDDKSTGGIVKADDARFNNNTTAVSFHPYENQFEHPYHPGTIVVRDNVSYFKNCEFFIDDEYIGPSQFEMHVNLHVVRGVSFKGCNFKYSDNANSKPCTMGIYAYDAGFKLGGICTSGNYSYPCQVIDNSTFDGFYKAVVSVNDGSVGIRPMTVKNTDFTNNSYGVFALRSGYPLILNSTFSIGQDSTQCAMGIYAEQTPNFTIEQDTFGIAKLHPYESYGIVIKNSKSQNQIYKNLFKGLYCANLSIGRNNTWMMPRNTDDAKSDILGLEYCCNENYENFCDFYVLGGNSYYKLGVQNNQGSVNVPANNTFSQGSRFHFMNHGNYGINYYYDPSLMNGTPNIYSIYGVTLNTTTDTLGCPSHYTFGGVSYNDTLTPVLSETQRLQREADYYEAYTAYSAIKSIYDGMINGGDTEGEISDIQSATPSDMWQLRSQLLGYSPFLTDEVLISMLGRDDVFPQSVYFEILASNPDELKNDTIFNYLQNMDNPLPDYMIGLLRQMADGVTARTAMESQLAHYSQKYRQAASDIIRSILCDSLIDKTSLVGWIGNMRDLESDREIVSIYLEEGNYTDAFALANMLPTLYGLTGDDLVEHNDYITLLELYRDLDSIGRTPKQLNNMERATVEQIANYGTGTPQAMAKTIMIGAYGYNYDDCPSGLDLYYPVKGLEDSGSSLSDEDLSRAMGFAVNVSPNPASTWVAIDYTLPAGATKAQMRIVNALGMTVGTYDLQGKETQKVLDLRDLASGVYTYTVFCGKYSQNGKLVIVK